MSMSVGLKKPNTCLLRLKIMNYYKKRQNLEEDK